jgi:hypothetical protein
MASAPTRLRVDPHTMPWVRRCESQKWGFASYDEALTGAERLMEAGKVKPGCHMTPYECDRCGEWHVYNRPIQKLQ